MGDDLLDVTVPTFRPDIRPAPMGEADIAEEVARTYGYARIARRTPSWPQPGRLTDRQGDRRLLKVVLCDLGASEAWTTTFLVRADQEAAGSDGPYVEVTNPLVESERYLRASMAVGLVRSVRHNLDRRQSGIRLFEIGSVFRRDEVRRGGVGQDLGAPQRRLRCGGGRCVDGSRRLADDRRGLGTRRLVDGRASRRGPPG